MSFSQMNMETFSSAKNQILKQKYECVNICLQQTEKRVNQIKMKNKNMRDMINQLENENRNKQNYTQRDIQQDLKRYKDEERSKLVRLDELKKLIHQYKFLCQQSMKYRSVQPHQPSNYSSSKVTKNVQPLNQSVRENSFMNVLDNSQNENINNISLVRNKSYKKIKTKIFCEICEVQYKPNQYYRHVQDCHKDMSESQIQMTARNKQALNSRSNGYKTMRN